MGRKRSSRRESSSGIEEKKRDWVEILVAPLSISLVAIVLTAWFSWQQDQRQNAIEDRRAESARRIEERRAQAEALQGYLDYMSRLMLETNLLRQSKDPQSNAHVLAEARTMAVLPGLGPPERGRVVRFLYDSGVLGGGLYGGASPDEAAPLSLEDANLKERS